MKIITTLAIVLLTSVVSVAWSDSTSGTTTVKSVGINAGNTLSQKLKFATREQAQKLLSNKDIFLSNLSQFDLDSRLGKPSATLDAFIAFRTKQVLGWNKTEKKRIQESIDRIGQIITKEGYQIGFPDEIVFLKSTMKDEGGVEGFTQGNFVVLSAAIMQMSDDEYLSP